MENNNYRKITLELQIVFNNLIIEKYYSKIVEAEAISFPQNPWNKEEIKFELQNPHSFNSIILVDNELLGYIFSHLIEDEVNINKICIVEKMRGKGLGTHFLGVFLKELKDRKIKRVFLEVRSNNLAAIRLYQKYGFIINRVRKNYYKDNEDAYEMNLTF